VIADWSEQLMNENAHIDSDTIEFGRAVSIVTVYDIEQGLAPIAVLHDASRYTLRMIPGDVYLLELN
jgi:hypothetical protein